MDDPIIKYLPEMKSLKLQDGTLAEISLRHLLTHTSGIAELPSGEAYTSKDLTEAASRYAKVDILFTPGCKWQYSQTSINTAARIVEVASGLSRLSPGSFGHGGAYGTQIRSDLHAVNKQRVAYTAFNQTPGQQALLAKSGCLLLMNAVHL